MRWLMGCTSQTICDRITSQTYPAQTGEGKEKKRIITRPFRLANQVERIPSTFFPICFLFFLIYFFGKRKISFRSSGDRKASLTSSFFPLSLSLSLLLRNNIEKHP
jgi:hypothetical protein